MNNALSEIHMSVDDSFAEGDKICIRWSATGKHTGAGLGILPTGVTIHVTGISILRVAGEKLIEAWQNWDMMGMMDEIQQAARRSATYISSPCKIAAQTLR